MFQFQPGPGLGKASIILRKACNPIADTFSHWDFVSLIDLGMSSFPGATRGLPTCLFGLFMYLIIREPKFFAIAVDF